MGQPIGHDRAIVGILLDSEDRGRPSPLDGVLSVRRLPPVQASFTWLKLFISTRELSKHGTPQLDIDLGLCTGCLGFKLQL